MIHREVVQRADFQRHGHVVRELERVGAGAQDPAADKSGHAHECPAVALLGQPLEVGQVLRVRSPGTRSRRVRQGARCPGFPVDLLGCAVAGDDPRGGH